MDFHFEILTCFPDFARSTLTLGFISENLHHRLLQPNDFYCPDGHLSVEPLECPISDEPDSSNPFRYILWSDVSLVVGIQIPLLAEPLPKAFRPGSNHNMVLSGFPRWERTPISVVDRQLPRPGISYILSSSISTPRSYIPLTMKGEKNLPSHSQTQTQRSNNHD